MEQFFQLQDLGAIAPELELALFGMIVLIVDLLVENKRMLGYHRAGRASALSGLLPVSAARRRDVRPTAACWSSIRFAWFFKLIFLIAAALSIAISLKYLDIERENHGEYYALILFATMGMMFMAGAMDLVTLYIGLETMAIATYVLVGFLRSNQRSNEASLKYFLLGAFSSGILLVWHVAALRDCRIDAVRRDRAMRCRAAPADRSDFADGDGHAVAPGCSSRSPPFRSINGRRTPMKARRRRLRHTCRLR